jgi:predicted dehydrogenase
MLVAQLTTGPLVGTFDLASTMSARNFLPKVVIVGKGSAGKRHARIVAEHIPDVELLHVGARDFINGNLMLEDLLDFKGRSGLSFAIVASPAPTHHDIALPFLNRGIPVLIEKPLASNVADARGIVAAAAKSGALVKVGYVMREYEDFARVEQLLTKNVIGKPYFGRFDVGQYLPDWRPAEDYRATVSAQAALGGGVLLELSHEIDLALKLFGCPSEVSCEADRYGGLDLDVEDSATLALLYGAPGERSMKAEIRMDFLRRVPSRTLEVHGSEGVLIWDALSHSIRYLNPTIGTWITAQKPDGPRADPFLTQLKSFVSQILGGFDPEVTGLEVVEVIEMCRKSISLNGKAVVFRSTDSG